MAQEGSVAPKERVNITYKSHTGKAEAEVELPLKLLLIGDYTGRLDERAVEDRKAINIDKDNFEQVLAEHKVSITVTTENTLSEQPGEELSATLNFQRLSDFGPESIAEQVPELRQLLELRRALAALKGPLGNIPAFRKRLQALLGNPSAREALVRELGLAGKEEG